MRHPRRFVVRFAVPALCLGFLHLAGTALAGPPSQTNRIHMSSKPAIVQVVTGWFARWVVNGESVPRGMVGSGTGFFIHPSGYILTNAHVVSDVRATDEELLQRARFDFLRLYLEAHDLAVNEANIGELLARMQRGQVPEPQLAEFNRFNYVFLQSGAKYPFEIKAYGAPIGGEGADVLTGKDVAVIKIEVRNAPTLRLGDSDSVQVGDHVWVMGYPAAAESDVLDQRSSLEPTTNDGAISARKTSRDGTPVLQTSTATTHGNSGGPVVNEKGEVIGLLTFRGNTVGGQEVQGFNFIVPINTALEFVRQAGTANEAGPVDAKWSQGLDRYWEEHYRLAKDTFQDVIGLFPEHSEATRLVTECAERIAAGADKSPTGKEDGGSDGSGGAFDALPLWAWIAIGGGTLVVVLVVVILVVRSGKKPAVPAAPPGYAGTPPLGYGRHPGTPGMPGAVPPGFTPPPGGPGMPGAAPPGFTPPPGGPGMPGVPSAVAKTEYASAPAVPAGGVGKTELFQAPSLARLEGVVGPVQGKEFPIGPGTLIGRDPARCQIVAEDSQVSGTHAWVGPVGGRIVLRDVGSTNGTFVNNRLEQRITEAPLNDGDVITLGQRGSVQFRFRS